MVPFAVTWSWSGRGSVNWKIFSHKEEKFGQLRYNYLMVSMYERQAFSCIRISLRLCGKLLW